MNCTLLPHIKKKGRCLVFFFFCLVLCALLRLLLLLLNHGGVFPLLVILFFFFGSICFLVFFLCCYCFNIFFSTLSIPFFCDIVHFIPAEASVLFFSSNNGSPLHTHIYIYIYILSFFFFYLFQHVLVDNGCFSCSIKLRLIEFFFVSFRTRNPIFRFLACALVIELLSNLISNTIQKKKKAIT